MYTKILIPLDGSKTAERVLPYARSLAGALKISVELVGVIDVDLLPPTLYAEADEYLETLVSDRMRTTMEYLRAIAGKFEGSTVQYFVGKGRPAEVIIARAAANKRTLIAMATHGRSGIGRWLLGSVAEKVLRVTANPLLLIRAAEEGKTNGEVPLKSIVVPLDGSQLAETVLPGVIELAKTMNLDVILARAYTLPFAAYAGADNYIPNYKEIRAVVREEASTYLAGKVKELNEEGLKNVSYILLEGSVPEEIIGFARRTPDNLVAMCTHGRSGIQRWVLGSVTEKVVRHSGDPVLVVRGRKSELDERKRTPAHLPEAEGFLKCPID